jgi:hypothetical protein
MVVGSDPPKRSSSGTPKQWSWSVSSKMCAASRAIPIRVPDPERFRGAGEAAGSVRGGIPVVSTRLGAEGLADRDGDICALADQPAEFAGAWLTCCAIRKEQPRWRLGRGKKW